MHFRLGVALALALLVSPTTVLASEDGPLGDRLPLWSVVPFVVMLMCIAILPLVTPQWWHHNKNRAIVSAVLGIPMAVWIAVVDWHELTHTLHHYIAFIVLLGSLYIVSGGIVVRGTLAGTPGVNTVIIGLGTVLASFIGTTGASMLLIRPILRANATRKRKIHIVVFFIFLVSNIGGLLTPLGDPPLFLGFLAGVPFAWTFGLTPQWAAVSSFLLIVFFVFDSMVFRREDVATPGDMDETIEEAKIPLQVVGKLNFLYLFGIVMVIVLSGTYKPPIGVQEAGMAAFAILSLLTTRREYRRQNMFSWEPIIEVAVVFAGIFATMIPALAILNAKGGELGLTQPWQYFWITGVLSSFLDNAPTYLTFTSTASGLMGTDAKNLMQLIELADGSPNVPGEALLTAISLGAVFMGANTYIGNGPNFMVKAIAEQDGVKMPSFFGYMVWSTIILVPVFVLVTFVFIL